MSLHPGLLRGAQALALAAGYLVASLSAAAFERLPEAPDFNLRDLRGHNVELRRAEGKVVVLFFTGVGCPIARQSVAKLRELRAAFEPLGAGFWLIDSFANDTRDDETREYHELDWRGPYLRDDSQRVALGYGVERTAEVVAVRTSDWKVIYQGAIDDQFTEGAQRPAPTAKYLQTALEESLAGKPVSARRTNAHGCRIAYAAPNGTEPSYARDIAPLLRNQCANCHREGGIGPWAMTGYDKVRNYSRMIEEVLLTGQMPPWHADPDFGRFKNHRGMSAAESQTLLRWIAAGAPRGEGPDPLADPPPAFPDWPMGAPNLVVRLPEVQSVPATGVLDYRHVQVRLPGTNEIWIGGIDVRPGNRRIVHHVILRAQWPGGPDDGSGHGVNLAGWAPGMELSRFQTGVGKTVPAGATLDFELHYTTVGSPQSDQTEAAFYLLPAKPERELTTREAIQTDLDIPPGVEESRESAVYGFRKPATLYTLMPHMHFRGKWARFELLTPNGHRETLLNVPRYDFNWQTVYHLENPRHIPAGSWLLVTGGFDNSPANPSNPDPHKRIHFGLQTWDEMFIGFFDAADDAETPTSAVQASIRSPASDKPVGGR